MLAAPGAVLACGQYRTPQLAAGTITVCMVVLQTKSYFIILDWGREELLLDWVRALLQCIK